MKPNPGLVKRRPKRRGKKGECQRELHAALVPIIKRYVGCWSKDEYGGFLELEFDAIVDEIVFRGEIAQRRDGE